MKKEASNWFLEETAVTEVIAYQTDWIIHIFDGKGQLFVPHWITVIIDHTRLQFLKERIKAGKEEMKNKYTNRKLLSTNEYQHVDTII